MKRGCCIQAREGAVQQSAHEASEAAARAEEDHAGERMRLGQALADMTKQAELVRDSHLCKTTSCSTNEFVIHA